MKELETDELEGWVLTAPIPEVVRRMEALRRGGEGEAGLYFAALAARALQTFALRRPLADLLRLEPDGRGDTDHFHPVDATAILALAALTRDVEQAAELAIHHWLHERKHGSGPTPLTDGIVHDVTAQRTVPETAVFIRTCRRTGQHVLVRKTLEAFVSEASGRTNLDKALLYLTLDTDLKAERCAPEAAMLLELVLRGAAAESRNHTGDEKGGRVGIIGALNHLSPSGKIVERWADLGIDEREADQGTEETGGQEKEAGEFSDRRMETIELVAELLLGEPEGTQGLAEHIGRAWVPSALRDLCERLVGSPNSRFDTILRSAAARTDSDQLSTIISTWQQSDTLSGTLAALLDELVAAGPDGSGGPRPIKDLDRLDRALRNDRAPQECRKMLRVAVAQHVAGRTGGQTARQLGQIEDRRDLKHAAAVVNQRLTARLVAGETGAEALVDYLKELRKSPRRSSALTFWALRALTDATASESALKGEVIGAVAVRLYAEGLGQVAFDLLERYLENEQAATPQGAVDLVDQVAGSMTMAGDPRWESLLSATVGRWAEAERRDDILDNLRAQRLSSAYETILHSVQ
jgi:hypothetical protein